VNIIVIEDHNSLRSLIVSTLEKKGFSVLGLPCAEDLDDIAGGKSTDLFIIDLNLPDEDGISLTKRIRSANPTVGIIMLTARSRLEDKILGYESGADIYLTKPIALPELLAAINSINRRLQQSSTFEESYLMLDCSLGVLRSDYKKISLNETEVIIFQALARAKNKQLEYWQLLEAIGEDSDSESAKSHLSVIVHRLRKKISYLGYEKDIIKSRHQLGYQLCVSVNIF
jgi:DNA-binding response OmpR family regulator